MKLTSPLAKGISTTEGVLVYVTNLVLALAAILPHGLSWAHTGLFAAILNGAYALSRALVKIAAIQKGFGVPAPKTVNPVDPAVVAAVVSEVIGILNPPKAQTSKSASVTTSPPVATPVAQASVPLAK